MPTQQTPRPGLRAPAAMADDHALSVRLRPETPADEPFIWDLHRAVRAQETGLHGAAFEGLLRAQYEAEVRDHEQQHPGLQRLVICLRSNPVGHLSLEWSAAQVEILDIVIAEEARNRGVGRAAFASIINQARARDLPVHLRVAHGNPAINLYRRMGFVVDRHSETHKTMVLAPTAPQPGDPLSRDE